MSSEFGAKILNKFKIYFSEFPTPISELIVLSLLKVRLEPCAAKCKLLNALDNNYGFFSELLTLNSEL